MLRSSNLFFYLCFIGAILDTQKIFCYQNKDKSSLTGETPANDPYLLIKKRLANTVSKTHTHRSLKSGDRI